MEARLGPEVSEPMDVVVSSAGRMGSAAANQQRVLPRKSAFLVFTFALDT
jgi:hypothetical protein